jgi:hypothetical protein
MYVCNKEAYGFLPVPLRAHSSLQDEAESFLHVQLEVMGESFAHRTLVALASGNSAGKAQLNTVFLGDQPQDLRGHRSLRVSVPSLMWPWCLDAQPL